MLYIFDQQKTMPVALGVMLDGVVSLLRQWTLRPHIGDELPASPQPKAAADHIPSFGMLDPFRPRAAAVMNGAVLSLILFCMTVFAIRYSWSHVLHLHIREIGTDWSQQVRPQAVPHNGQQDAPSSHSSWLQLDSYIGEYVSSSPPTRISVRIEGDHLALAFRGQPSLALSPLSPKRFVIDGIANNYADFTSDSSGRICCLSVVIRGKIVTAQREYH